MALNTLINNVKTVQLETMECLRSLEGIEYAGVEDEVKQLEAIEKLLECAEKLSRLKNKQDGLSAKLIDALAQFKSVKEIQEIQADNNIDVKNTTEHKELSKPLTADVASLDMVISAKTDPWIKAIVEKLSRWMINQERFSARLLHTIAELQAIKANNNIDVKNTSEDKDKPVLLAIRAEMQTELAEEQALGIPDDEDN